MNISKEKKFDVKTALKVLMLSVPFVAMAVVMMIVTSKVSYYQIELDPISLTYGWIKSSIKAVIEAVLVTMIPQTLFSLVWIGFIISVTLSLKGRLGQIVYGIFFAVFFASYTAQLIYYPYTGVFFNFNLIRSAEEGTEYIWDTVKGAPIWAYAAILLVLALGVLMIVRFPKSNRNRFGVLIASLLILSVSRLCIPFMYGSAVTELGWDSWKNPRNVYNTYSDVNKSIKISGIYEFTFRDAWLTVFSSAEKMSDEEAEFLDSAYSQLKSHRENEYTGIFSGKNVIFLQLEGIDSWLLNEKDTPNLYGMLNNSIVFDDHYSYYNGGGSTFNSEFAVVTGFITPLSYAKNAYLFNTNTFPKSLPRLFKDKGYTANAFHMNNGEYYMREINYRSWGFDDYYSLIEDRGYTEQEAKFDTLLIEDELFYQKMFKQEQPFLDYIITFSNHMPFTTGNKVIKTMLRDQHPTGDLPDMSEEEVARLLVGETDRMVGLLLEALEDNGLAENTVIVAFADHYLYTLVDKTVLDEYKNTDNNLINCTPFFIWSKGMEPVTVSSANSQLDILPTVLNMFGIDYDDGYYIGSDIMAPDYKGYVFFSDYSWYDGNCYVELGEVTQGTEYDSEYISESNKTINSLINRNDLTLKYDYLKKLQ